MEKLEMQELSGNEDCRNRVFPLLAIAFACFILHGLILLNERPFWDGLLLFHLLRTGNWPEIRTWFHDAGLPSFAYIYWGVGAWVPFPVLAFRLLTFSSLLATSWFFYGICRYFNLSRSTSTQLAVLACAYPIHQVSVEIIMAPGNFMIALFYLSALFAFYAARHSGWKRWCLWGSSLIGFFFSFVQESLLTFYLGFLILYLWNRVREGENRSNTQIRSWIKTLARNLDYLVVPVVYLILKRLFFWPTGSFAAYNRVKLSPWNLADNTWISLKNGLFFHLDCAFAFYSLSQILLIFALVSFLGKRSISSGSDRTAERAESIGMGLVGVALWFLGMVLYVLAQKPLMAVGTETRYAMLLGPPTSLLILATLRYWIPVPRYRGTIYALLLFAFSVVTWKSHLDWQGRTVKDMAIIRSLKKTPPPKDYTSFMVQDDLPMISKRGDQIYGSMEKPSPTSGRFSSTKPTQAPKESRSRFRTNRSTRNSSESGKPNGPACSVDWTIGNRTTKSAA
jgi:hypothetical protein